MSPSRRRSPRSRSAHPPLNQRTDAAAMPGWKHPRGIQGPVSPRMVRLGKLMGTPLASRILGCSPGFTTLALPYGAYIAPGRRALQDPGTLGRTFPGPLRETGALDDGGYPAGPADCGLIVACSVRRSGGLATEVRTPGAQKNETRRTPGKGGVRVAGAEVCEPAKRGAWSWGPALAASLRPRVAASGRKQQHICGSH